jgi:hypothetical protein
MTGDIFIVIEEYNDGQWHVYKETTIKNIFNNRWVLYYSFPEYIRKGIPHNPSMHVQHTSKECELDVFRREYRKAYAHVYAADLKMMATELLLNANSIKGVEYFSKVIQSLIHIFPDNDSVAYRLIYYHNFTRNWHVRRPGKEIA